MFLCLPVVVSYTLGPGQTQNFAPLSPPAPVVDDYKVMVELNEISCDGTPTCYSPTCTPLLACLLPSAPGYAIRRVP
jgi:hypothetical protein